MEQAFLIEYFGESGPNGNPKDIDYDNIVINEMFQTEFISDSNIVKFKYEAKNIDTWNNTYTCVRYDDSSISNFKAVSNDEYPGFEIGGEIFCKFATTHISNTIKINQ